MDTTQIAYSSYFYANCLVVPGWNIAISLGCLCFCVYYGWAPRAFRMFFWPGANIL